MRQIWISKPGGPEALRMREGPDPLPRNGEVRVRTEAVGVNFVDLLGRMGVYRTGPAIPYVPGLEIAGVVDAVGQGVPDFKEGDAVFGLTQFGGYSDAVCVPYRLLFKRLEWMPATDAAALPVSYLTAFQMLIVMASVRAGDKVLIHNAGGSVGLAALDICLMLGAETFGTASPQKHDFLLARGLQHAIDYRNRDFERVVNDLTAGKGVHVILDPVGGTYWPKNYRLLMPSGRLIFYGMSSIASGRRRSWWSVFRSLVMLPFYTPLGLMRENKGVMGVNLNNLWQHTTAVQAWMRQIVNWYDEALFRPHVDRIFRFEQAADAHEYVQDRQNVGKVLLQP